MPLSSQEEEEEEGFLKCLALEGSLLIMKKEKKTGGEMYAEVFFMSRIVNYGGGRKKLGIHWLSYALL